MKIINSFNPLRCLAGVFTFLLLFLSISLLLSNNAMAATVTDVLDSSCITITNNAAGTYDIVSVTGLKPKDLVKVYNASSGGKLLATGRAGSSSGEVTIKISQIGTSAGSLYISVTSSGFTESSRAEVNYDSEPESSPPDSSCITITNNAAGTYDTIYISGLSYKDIVKVYNASTGGRLLATGTVTTSSGDVSLRITQLGSLGGSVYISVKSSGCLESSRVEVNFGSEPESTSPSANLITVTNNALGTSDTVYVSGLTPGDVVKVYSTANDKKMLAKATVAASCTDVTLKISQIGSAEGSVFISVTNSKCMESSRTEVHYDAEPGSDNLDASCITVSNNAAGTYDTIYITGLCAKDVVKVYNTSSGGKLLVTGTVSSNSSDITLRVSQLGSAAGSVYISVKNSGCVESGRTQADYVAESRSSTPYKDLITVTNNPKESSDTITITGLSEGDLIKVYKEESSGVLLGSGTVQKTLSSVTIKIAQLGIDSGTVYISRKSATELESSRIAVAFSAEAVSNSADQSDITVTNSPKGTADTVYVKRLNSGDVVKVYSASTGGTLLGSATSSGSDVTISIAQLEIESGTVYVTVTCSSQNESARVAASYSAEASSTAPAISSILVSNNPAGTADTVFVSELNTNDIVKVYSKSGSLLGKATVTAGTTTTINITQLGAEAGAVYVTNTSTGKAESEQTKVDYTAEAVSNAPDSVNVIITNTAAGTADTIYVTGLKENDVVNVYRTAKKGTVLGTAKVASGTTYATVSIAQLGSAADSVSITVTSEKSLESSCTEVSYSAEATSNALDSANIIITNNVSGTADSVYASGLSDGDIVKVYDKAVQGTLLGSATYTSSTVTSASSAGSATISITQLGTGSGIVYITVTSKGKNESPVTEVKYLAEQVSKTLDADNVTVINNSGSEDSVFVTGVASGDVITVYKTSSKATKLGTAATASGASSVTVSIPQIGADAGTIYVSLTSVDCLEGNLTSVSFAAEAGSSALDKDTVSVTNNYKSSDTVVVTGLAAGDVINVYDAAAGGILLGTATVASTASTATVTISQLGAFAGDIYISKTSKNQTESTRTKVSFSAEPVSAAPAESNVTIQNNANSSDTITVIGLKQGDVVTVYKTLSESNTWGSGTVSASSSSITITVPQLDSTAGSVYITVTNTDASESERTRVSYSAEAQSTAPDAKNVTVVNNYNIKSTVTVTGLANNDTVNVYSASAGGTLLGTGTVTAYGNSVVISLSGLDASGGTIYLTVVSTNKSESSRSPVTYSAQSVSAAPSASEVTIVNNAGIADKITLKGINTGTIINVYDSETGGTLQGTSTASTTSATVSIDQLGVNAGSIYITATTSGKTESSRTEVSYTAESASDIISSGNVTVVNNSDASDTISITGLSIGDVVKVYKDSTTTSYITTMTATGNLTTTVTISQLGTSSGTVYLTVATSGKTESDRAAISYAAESKAPVAADITIVNNAGINDTISVVNLSAGDIVNVYGDNTTKAIIGTALVSSSGSSASISISQLSTAAGYIYISVTNSGCAESSLTKASYLSEQTTEAPDDGDVYIVNNATGTSDTVTVHNLNTGDVIKVYATDGSLLGKATASSSSSSATVTISDLGATEGSIYVTKKTKGKNESDKTEVVYSAESKSSAPYVGDISVVNNVLISDTITVSKLSAGSLVKVYNLSSLSSYQCLGYATVESGRTSVTISIPQLGTESGTVYVSVTENGKTESDATIVYYVAEAQSNGISLSNITIVNNPSGTSDVITITGLNSGDVIQVYDLSADGNLIGSATATSSETVTISIPQLGSLAGNVYITTTSLGKTESNRVKANYAAE